jgi:hypothetical protein
MDSGLFGESDEEQLAFSTVRRCVLYRFNVGAFYRLPVEWIAAGRTHAGILLAQQQRFSAGKQLRRICAFAVRTAADMVGQVEFLGNWG